MTHRALAVENPHFQSLDALLSQFSTDGSRGLEPAEAASRLSRLGPNALEQRPPVPKWRRFVSQFNQLVVWILIVAAVISGLMGEWTDTIVILSIVALNGGLGFYQEERAEESLAALKELSAPAARVRRGGESMSIPASEVVPGDVIELEAGDLIPADARLLQCFSFRTQEAPLTGESSPVDKLAIDQMERAVPIGDRKNMVFAGTTSTAGKASALVVATGMQTELGQIAGLLDRGQRVPTPLERRLTELGRVLVAVCLVLVAVIFSIHVFRGGDLLEVLLLSVSLAVAAVPEGLPGVVTICLAVGLQRMVKRNALIRKLASVETLGSVTCICSDKTGTLTRNEMTVREIDAGSHRFSVTGEGYRPEGAFLKRRIPDGDAQACEPTNDSDLAWVLTIGVRCNDARLVKPETDKQVWKILGDPTEAALLVAAAKAGVDFAPDLGQLLDEIPFDPERRAMSVVRADADGVVRIYTKGAPEAILALCTEERIDARTVPLSATRRAEILGVNSDMASRALRVLALAYRDDPSRAVGGAVESELIFAGLVGMIDPPRLEVRAAIEQCRTAGIAPIMITGDHPATATAIARELGLATGREQVMTGVELDELSDEALNQQVGRLSVFARASALHKLRIVESLKQCHQIVAMTGDGVNDAPAVKAAHIGIAMGITGTAVTKDASDMVLLDDNFASIVNAVSEGRRIYDNIQKVIYFLLACNAGEVLTMFFAALFGWPVPLVAVQILWINLVTDGLPAIALALEPAEPDVMERPPRPSTTPMITIRGGIRILVGGILMATVTLVGFGVAYRGSQANLGEARATAFCILVFAQLCYSFGSRSQRFTLPQLGQFSNPTLFIAIVSSGLLQIAVVLIPLTQRIFNVDSSRSLSWGMIAILSLTPVTVIEVAKLVRGRFFPQSR